MRTVTKQQVDQLQVSGGKVRKLTETPKPPPPAPEIPDHTDQLASIEKQIAEIRARGQEVELYSKGEGFRVTKAIEHLTGKVHELKHSLEHRQKIPNMVIHKGGQGFISHVTIGRLVFKFKRNRIGTCQEIEVTTK